MKAIAMKVTDDQLLRDAGVFVLVLGVHEGTIPRAAELYDQLRSSEKLQKGAERLLEAIAHVGEDMRTERVPPEYKGMNLHWPRILSTLFGWTLERSETACMVAESEGLVSGSPPRAPD